MTQSFKNRQTRRKQTESLFQDAIQAKRAELGTTTLRDSLRANILDEAFKAGSASEPLPSLFAPTWRLAIAGALPVLLAVALLAGLEGREVADPNGTPTLVRVGKLNGQIVFDITNGKTSHRVYRADSPTDFDRNSGVAVKNGKFQDRINEEESLVFYRID